jgi:hypothetical protein
MLLSPTLILLTAIGSGCGSPYPVNRQSSSTSTTSEPYSQSSTPVSVGASSPGVGGQAPFQVKIQGNGYDSHSVTVTTGNTLKVAFIPGKQNSEANGVFYPYSMLAVYVGVGTNLQPTQLLYNGYYGQSAQESSVIDLSGAFASKCNSGDTSCRQQVTVIVAQPNDDDSCLNTGLGCPYSHVPSGHPWNGTLIIETDDTSPI